MKRITVFVVATALLSGVALAQGTTPKGDRAAVGQIIERWNRAWQMKDAKLDAQDYSDDADCTNAFG